MTDTRSHQPLARPGAVKLLRRLVRSGLDPDAVPAAAALVTALDDHATKSESTKKNLKTTTKTEGKLTMAKPNLTDVTLIELRQLVEQRDFPESTTVADAIQAMRVGQDSHDREVAAQRELQAAYGTFVADRARRRDEALREAGDRAREEHAAKELAKIREGFAGFQDTTGGQAIRSSPASASAAQAAAAEAARTFDLRWPALDLDEWELRGRPETYEAGVVRRAATRVKEMVL